MLRLSSIFVLFFITLGPLKTIAPFVGLTGGFDPALRRQVAIRATLAATAIVLALAAVGPVILKNWGVSFPAVTLTGGLVLILLSLQLVLSPEPSAAPPERTQQPFTAAVCVSRLVIPTIVTPPGIAAILALSVFSEGNRQLWLQIIAVLLLVMAVNLATMLAARRLLAFLTVAGLRVIGWVFAVLQASLGMQVIIDSVRRLGFSP